MGPSTTQTLICMVVIPGSMRLSTRIKCKLLMNRIKQNKEDQTLESPSKDVS